MENKFSRQSFLGEQSQDQIENTIVGVVGLGGGGSHITQQLAHLGFLNFIIADPDRVEDHNLNRLIGGQMNTVGEKKIDVAKRMITSVRPNACIQCFDRQWQDCAEDLRKCDIIFGASDGFRDRRDLEAFARRFLIPVVDIAMDVVVVEPEAPQMNGQVILSMPGHACMRCMGFITEGRLGKEAAAYGDAGIRPQVVWANGVLASTAVGIAVDLITDWTRGLRSPPYLSYKANTSNLTTHVRAAFLKMDECPHFPLDQIGAPKLQAL